MTTIFSSRFHRNASDFTTKRGKKYVNDMQSDSSDDECPLGGNVRQNPMSGRLNQRSRESLEGDGAVDRCSTVETKVKSIKSKHIETEKKQNTLESLSWSESSRTSRRQLGKKWYNDSDEEEDEVVLKQVVMKSKVESNQQDERKKGLNRDLYIAGLMVESPKRKCDKPALMMSANQSRFEFNRLAIDKNERLRTKESTFDANGKAALSSELLAAHNSVKKNTPSASEHTTLETQPCRKTRIGRPAEVQTKGNGIAPIVLINRRTDQLKHSASGSDYSGSPRLAISHNDEVLSPGLRKVPGALPGRPGSGVLLEGWLRQKQRRGMKGLKKWNSRYFVLYAQSNEVRYYADVVQSAWGPIPLGEIGSISLRLIQRIGKLSHPKYKGCRFDITCRNSWGTHYPDDYVSSDEENASSNNHTNSNSEKTEATVSKQEKGGTPRSSRVYSLVADSPQITIAWVNMLDSLLTRSANSPRPDVGSPCKTTSGTPTANVNGGTKEPQAVAQQRSSAPNTESVVILGPGECVPKATINAINFIFDSTPGIETELFYEVEPDATKLKAALKFLNAFAGETATRKPTKIELEEVLDAITAGAVVCLWLKQLEQPLIPFILYDDFEALARKAQTAPMDLRPKLCALLKALPTKNLTMLACLLFHLNDVNMYSSKNGMDAAKLAHHFAQFILRPEKKKMPCESNNVVDCAITSLVKEMIINVDTFIDEKEAQVLEENRLG
ncbi:unnamed protein product [Peronospora belbahrii]|uniref:Rho-GAP domain-containing protein n=1 Tax=Peronospora belbahrii TaxID=622444 RepID=A0ABN8DA76_9STRA|nr:unnamed protein product [Peronospora belbahrii]